MLYSTGTIITNPQSKSTALGQWWMIVEACTELGRYYNQMLKFANRCNPNFALQRPSWGYHISVLRGETIILPEAIELYISINGTLIEFEYEHEIISNGRYFWLPVTSEKLLDLRERLGLARR